jgi:selenocysteine lyase/cysteine desulfurase
MSTLFLLVGTVQAKPSTRSGSQIISEGCIVYISPFEHNAVTRTLHHIAKKKNIKIRQLKVDPDTLYYDIHAIQQQFQDEPPHCVIISHASNVTGTVAPIRDIFSLAKHYNSVTVADMCQTAGLIDTDISSSYFDYVVFAGHKTLYGPLGISGFICQYPEQLPPLIYGGTGIESANQDMPMSSPERFEAGSHSSIAIAGLNASVKWMRFLKRPSMVTRMRSPHRSSRFTERRHLRFIIIRKIASAA